MNSRAVEEEVLYGFLLVAERTRVFVVSRKASVEQSPEETSWPR